MFKNQNSRMRNKNSGMIFSVYFLYELLSMISTIKIYK